MTKLETNKNLTGGLTFRWKSRMYSWKEKATFCHGATLASKDYDLITELSFLNRIAWTLDKMENNE